MDEDIPQQQPQCPKQIAGLSEGPISSDTSSSPCESSLNPNAAEFIPSFIRCSGDVKSDQLTKESSEELKKTEKKTESTTTLVNQEIVGDAVVHQKRTDAQNRHIQRQLFNLLKQMGNQNLPLAQIEFSLIANGLGVSVQFMLPEVTTTTTTPTTPAGSKFKLDTEACQAAAIRLMVGNKPTRGQALIMPFLSRMSEILTRSQSEKKVEKPSLCPRCESLPNKPSYTELEIERQIDYIKAFEKVINDDGGRRYQQAFKELCHKLGLAAPDDHLNYFECCVLEEGGAESELQPNPKEDHIPSTSQYSKSNKNTKQNEDQTSDEDIIQNNNNNASNKCYYTDPDDQLPYDWDTFTTDFSTMKNYSYANVGGSEVHVNHIDESPRERKQLSTGKKFHKSATQGSGILTKSKANVSSSYSKLFKMNTMKCNSAQVAARKTGLHKDKDRWRHSMPGRSTASGAVNKTTAEPHYLTSNRSKLLQREVHPKSSQIRNQMSELTKSHIVKAATKCEVTKSQQIDTMHT